MSKLRRLPPLATLRVFEAVARHLNLTRAAGELGMTQSAVSYQLKQLEEWLGLPLVLRTTRSAALTEEGRVFAASLHGIFDQLGIAVETAQRKQVSGTLAITTFHTFGMHWLTPRLGSLHARVPDMTVQLDLDGRLVDFKREAFDVGFRVTENGGKWPDLISEELFTFDLTPMMTPSMRARLGADIVPEDLLRLPRIGMHQLAPNDVQGLGGDYMWRTWFEAAGATDSGSPLTLELQAQATAGQAVLAGHGVALLTPWLFRRELAEGLLIAPFSAVVPERNRCYFVYPADRAGDPKIVAFRDWLQDEIAAHNMLDVSSVRLAAASVR